MKHVQLIVLIACASSFVGCESTDTAGRGNAETKRMAALEERKQHEAQMDETQKNLWNAENDILNRDGSATAGR
jgi:hypothetical protein